ncbi:hypothetical protein IPL68_00420 [Candidatus Saccharibacteria bacterium]|nr:MAG: hypothetical protein IPL68_00420 [Candidatus Saccharibacteria bacterium]
MMVAYPVVGAHLLALGIGDRTGADNRPREKNAFTAQQIFHNHPGLRIAIAGSYGKTTMKELLATVLGEAKNVAATPGNMNVVSSCSVCAQPEWRRRRGYYRVR